MALKRATMAPLLVSKLSDMATVPTRGSPLSAGFDLYAAHETTVPAGGKALVKTDLAIKCPEGTYGRVAPRSGLAWKKHIDVGAGVIDADYRGNVGVVLFNHSSEDLPVKVGDRVAQLVLEQVCMADLKEVDSLDETERGAGGFGSTGVSGGPTAGSPKRRRTLDGPEDEVAKEMGEGMGSADVDANDGARAGAELGELLVAVQRSQAASEEKATLRARLLRSDVAALALAHAYAQEALPEDELLSALRSLPAFPATATAAHSA